MEVIFSKTTKFGKMIMNRYPHMRGFVLTIPVVAVLLVLFVFPLSKIFVRSFMAPDFTLKFYLHLYNAPVYLSIFVGTFHLVFLVTVITLALGYPVAYFLTKLPQRISNLLMICVMIPFWTSVLVRSYSWMVLLQREGVINKILGQLGLIDYPLKMMFNTFGVVVGMVHYFLPFMILPIYSVMTGIDKNLLKAAENLGASPTVAWWKVFFPLSLPGVGAGCLLVFMMGIGFFITPSLLGGRTDYMISMAIENLVNELVNWGLASTLAVVLLVVTIMIYLIYSRVLGLDRIWGGSNEGR